MSDLNVCVQCSANFTLTASEKARFSELKKSVKGFEMPRRCPECRRKRREEKVEQVGGVRPIALTPMPPVPVVPNTTVQVPPTPMVMVAAPAIIPTLSGTVQQQSHSKEEVRLILATTDFEDLVHGKPIVWQGVRVILADIGFKVMRAAIDRAETERAKILYHRNGSAQASGETAS